MRRGFTLIELLIVVAIIAILAAIAVPNFMEAQVRSKVSRTHADMRSLATAIEAYAVDDNRYPILHSPNDRVYTTWCDYLWVDGVNTMSHVLSTPIAYISSHPTMVFTERFDSSGGYRDGRDTSYLFANFQGAASSPDCKDGSASHVPFGEWDEKILVPTPVKFKGQEGTRFANWLLFSVGPVGILDLQPGTQNINGESHTNPRGIFWDEGHYTGLWRGSYEIYDPTNGTMSYGLIWRLGGGTIAN